MTPRKKTKFQTTGGWTEPRIAVLRSGVAQGKSASQIAAILGDGCSRSTVCAKAHRIGLKLKGGPVKLPAGNVPTARSKQRDRLVVVKPDIADVADIMKHFHEPSPALLPDGKHHTLMELKDSQCRWPHGDPKHPVFHFCAHRVKDGSPYCPHHSSRAWQPKQKTPGEKLDIRMSAFALRAREAA